ncbi:hypothetical protein PVAP13_2NG257506 [Panicum virgatum]|uniref:Uncharacterized protein n=1 Tax=Panicum virgatum TaxID=38727 RepID=A0A8T0VGS5_PANVG|nr:hypothetical protein PVAP13_2NG257506 [Panicum virgatum]
METAAAAHGVLLRDGHHAGHDVQHPGELHPHGQPARAGLGGDADGLVVQGQLQAVHVAAPPGRLGGAQVETVVGEADAELLDPGEVAPHARVALADEVGVDVQAGVGEDAEVLVPLAVEVLLPSPPVKRGSPHDTPG